MTMTITLSQKQAERLKVLAAMQGLDVQEFAETVLVQAIESAEPEAPVQQPRPFGLARGEFRVPANFDAPLSAADLHLG